MSLPTVVVFERHWDMIPKQTIKHLLSPLKAKGLRKFMLRSPTGYIVC